MDHGFQNPISIWSDLEIWRWIIVPIRLSSGDCHHTPLSWLLIETDRTEPDT
ncbi:hypothetical protein ACE6H2_010980 [Prunus campanulata]